VVVAGGIGLALLAGAACVLGGCEIAGIGLAAGAVGEVVLGEYAEAAAAPISEAAAPMGEVTENGAEITYSATATAIGSDDETLQNLARSQGVGGHDVIVHGLNGQFITNGMPTNPQQIADAVLGNPAYQPGSTINLVTCGGACGLAQELGAILKATVNAMPGDVDLDPHTGALRDLR